LVKKQNRKGFLERTERAIVMVEIVCQDGNCTACKKPVIRDQTRHAHYTNPANHANPSDHTYSVETSSRFKQVE
jgi:hypothetical protein